MRATLLLAALGAAACSGTPAPVYDAGPGIPAPVVQGALGFDAGLVLESSQTSGGGVVPGDNLSISVEEGCGGSGLDNRSLSISLYSRDHSKLTAGAITVEVRSSGTSGNVFANVDYQDFRTGTVILPAKSGTVTMTTVDFDKLNKNAGTFDVLLDLGDGGTSQLTGSFDGRYLCH